MTQQLCSPKTHFTHILYLLPTPDDKHIREDVEDDVVLEIQKEELTSCEGREQELKNILPRQYQDPEGRKKLRVNMDAYFFLLTEPRNLEEIKFDPGQRHFDIRDHIVVLGDISWAAELCFNLRKRDLDESNIVPIILMGCAADEGNVKWIHDQIKYFHDVCFWLLPRLINT